MKCGLASWEASAEGAVRATAESVSAVLVWTSGGYCTEEEAQEKGLLMPE